MEAIPRSVAYATARLSSYNVNSYKLEPSSATTAGPSSIITFALPSNASGLDLRSFRVKMDVATTSDSSSTNVIYAKLPADASSLVHSVELFAGGVCIAQGTPEYGTIAKVKKIINSSRDRDGSWDSTLAHGVISVDDAVDDVSMVFIPTVGFFHESSTRFINSAILGDIVCRITLATNAVLTYKEHGITAPANFSDAAARTAALNTTFQVSNLSATINSCSFGDVYEKMLLDRLSEESHLSLFTKEYYHFSLHGTQSTAHDVRFALSASSIDRLYTICRSSSYLSPGQRMRAYPGASQSDANCSNFYFFQSFDSKTTKRGSLRWTYNVNSVSHPMYQADILDAAAECQMVADSHGLAANGCMLGSLNDFHQGKCVIPLALNVPGQPVALASGYDARGNSAQMSVSIQGQVLPTADADSQVVASLSTTVIAETTQEIMIHGAKSLSVRH